MFRKTVFAGATVLAVAATSPTVLAQATNNFHQINKMFTSNRNKEVETLADAGRWAKKLVGSAIAEGQLAADNEEYLTVLLNQFDYLTPENSGKWGSLQGEDPNLWDFTLHDQVVDFAIANEKIYKGHTLVWHSQAPAFIDDGLSAAELANAIEAHIVETMGRYKGEIYAWDVVNEAIDDNAEFRQSVFYTTLGEQYIADAFYTADAVDPKAILYYNDYNVAGINAKSNAVYDLVAGLVAQGVPIDGVGFQMHLTATGAPGFDELKANLQRFADLGLRVNISELDVRIADLPWDQATNFAIQQQVYHRVAAACVAVSGCESLTTWGFTDAYSWIDATFAPDDPLEYDESYNRKPAWYGLVDGLVGVAPDALGTAPNLVANGQFESGMDGWVGIDSDTYRLWRRTSAFEGLSQLYVDDRQGPQSGAAYDLTGVVAGGQSYAASAVVRIQNANEDTVNLEVYYRCEDGSEGVLSAASGTFYRREWIEFGGEFTLPSCPFEAVALRLNGPIARVDMMIDAVAVRPLTLVPDTEGLGENILFNSDFENGTDWWFGFGPSVIEPYTERTNSGSQAIAATGRTDTWNGVATNLLDFGVVPGAQYQLLSFVSVNEGSAGINATLQAQCAGEEAEYIFISNASATDSAFSLLAGTVAVPGCELTTAFLYFEGPAAGVDLLLDDVYLFEVLNDGPSDNLLANGDFETGVAGWFGWGSATVAAATGDAQNGDGYAVASNRTASWQGLATNILALVVPGEVYDISAYGRISGSTQDTLGLTFKFVCAVEGESYIGVTSVTATDLEWTQLSGSVTVPACDLTEASLYFEGPSEGVDILVDNVVLNGDSPGSVNLVTNPDFEAGTEGWFNFAGTFGVSTDNPFSGAQSAVQTERTATWNGIVYDFTAAATAGETYDISAYSRLEGGSANIGVNVRTTCDGEPESDAFIAATPVAADWVPVTATVTLPDCVLTQVWIIFNNADAGIDIFMDEVSITVD